MALVTHSLKMQQADTASQSNSSQVTQLMMAGKLYILFPNLLSIYSSNIAGTGQKPAGVCAHSAAHKT